jgi:hypothetical protein
LLTSPSLVLGDSVGGGSLYLVARPSELAIAS